MLQFEYEMNCVVAFCLVGLVYADRPYRQQRWMRSALRRTRWGDTVMDQTLPPVTQYHCTLYSTLWRMGRNFPRQSMRCFSKENSAILALSQQCRDSLQLWDFSLLPVRPVMGKKDLSLERTIWNWIFLTMALLAARSECISLPISLFCRWNAGKCLWHKYL